MLGMQQDPSLIPRYFFAGGASNHRNLHLDDRPALILDTGKQQSIGGGPVRATRGSYCRRFHSSSCGIPVLLCCCATYIP